MNDIEMRKILDEENKNKFNKEVISKEFLRLEGKDIDECMNAFKKSYDNFDEFLDIHDTFYVVSKFKDFLKYH